MRRALWFLFWMSTLAHGASAQATFGIAQNGGAVPLQPGPDGTYTVVVSPAPFTLTFDTHDGPAEVWLAFGREDLFDAARTNALFGPATAYARWEEPTAAHYMTDPLCALEGLPPGFNLLTSAHRTRDGFPVHALQTDSLTEECTTQGRLPDGVNLLGLINPLYAVVRTPAGDTRLILQFVGS